MGRNIAAYGSINKVRFADDLVDAKFDLRRLPLKLLNIQTERKQRRREQFRSKNHPS
jgi:hypothetical protein